MTMHRHVLASRHRRGLHRAMSKQEPKRSVPPEPAFPLHVYELEDPVTHHSYLLTRGASTVRITTGGADAIELDGETLLQILLRGF